MGKMGNPITNEKGWIPNQEFERTIQMAVEEEKKKVRTLEAEKQKLEVWNHSTIYYLLFKGGREEQKKSLWLILISFLCVHNSIPYIKRKN